MPDVSLPESLQFEPEAIDDVRGRYSGFGCTFFDELGRSLPEAFSHLAFYRPTEYQQNDVWAICSWQYDPFVVQLDPDCEVIVLSNGDMRIEIGTWESDPSRAGVDFVRDNFQ